MLIGMRVRVPPACPYTIKWGDGSTSLFQKLTSECRALIIIFIPDCTSDAASWLKYQDTYQLEYQDTYQLEYQDTYQLEYQDTYQLEYQDTYQLEYLKVLINCEYQFLGGLHLAGINFSYWHEPEGDF